MSLFGKSDPKEPPDTSEETSRRIRYCSHSTLTDASPKMQPLYKCRNGRMCRLHYDPGCSQIDSFPSAQDT